jgi:alpha-N-arabinofuranosidase
MFARYPPVAPGQSVSVGGQVWQQVSSLAQAGPNDRVYVLDRASGRIVFGDGVHGAVPASGSQVAITYTSGPHPGFVQFYRAMKAADPSIHVCAGYTNPQDPTEQPFPLVMGRAHRYDCLQVHPFKPLLAGMGAVAAHDYAMSGADQAAAEVATVQRELRRASGRPVPVTVSAYGLNDRGLNDRLGGAPSVDYLSSLDQGLFTASELVHWADLGVPAAARFQLINRNPATTPVTDPDSPDTAVFGFAPSFTPSASAEVFGLFSHMSGVERIASSVVGNPVRVGASGRYPALLELASRDRSGHVFLDVVNRDPVRAVTATVDVRSAPSAGVMSVWTVDGASTTSVNTPQDPDAVRTTKQVVRLPRGPFARTFPAHSITAIEL